MMKLFKTSLLILLLCFTSSILFSQNFNNERNNLKPTFYHTLKYITKAFSDTIYLDEEITSLSLSITIEADFTNAYIIARGDTVHIQEEQHDPTSENSKYSQLIIFEKPVKSFIFKRGNVEGDVLFHFINSGATPDTDRKNHKLKQGCGKPKTINQPEWRAGLPEPNYQPVYSKVNHVIIHHSAGSNDDINYTYVVRQIYLYHTEVRKYSDIAYNFLIAPNGAIYEGREGEEEREEDIVGAHFCGKNTNTMGVCLLGNYETVVPAMPMLESLEQLMAWKLSKENLDPFDANIHPAGTASTLGNIAGHRDGCPTLCPGEYVYALMDVIKENTHELIKDIGSEIGVPILVRNKIQESGDVILEVDGGEEGSYIWFTSENPEDSIPGENNSNYIIPPLFQDTVFYVAIQKGECIGNLLKIDIKVKKDRFHVYPNPSAGLTTILFNKSFKLTEFIVLNSLGQKVEFLEASFKENTIYVDTSVLSSGVYFVIVKSVDKTLNKKLIVN